MRLDGRQVRFVIPFWPAWRARTLWLVGRRGSVHLQETALVIEGELLRFSFLGIERLFRRALSEWTTVTVPYSRIDVARLRVPWLLRVTSALLALGVGAWGVFVIASTLSPRGGMLSGEVPLMLMMVVFCVLAWGLLLYVNLRVKPTVRVKYRSKRGRRFRLALVIRKRAARRAFLAALAAHRAAAARYAPPPGPPPAAGTPRAEVARE